MTHTANAMDDSDTLEFWKASGRLRDDLILGATCFETDDSALLIHIPHEIDWKLASFLVDHSIKWFSVNVYKREFPGIWVEVNHSHEHP